jgi:hypothetical protein
MPNKKIYDNGYSYRFVSDADELRHSSGPWKKHKYLQKIGNRYIYNLKEKIGLNARDRYNRADAAVQGIATRQIQNMNRSDRDNPAFQQYEHNLNNEYDRAKRERARAQADYEKTIIGRITKRFRNRKISTSHHDVQTGLRGESFVWEVGKGKKKKK